VGKQRGVGGHESERKVNTKEAQVPKKVPRELYKVKMKCKQAPVRVASKYTQQTKKLGKRVDLIKKAQSDYGVQRFGKGRKGQLCGEVGGMTSKV